MKQVIIFIRDIAILFGKTMDEIDDVFRYDKVIIFNYTICCKIS